MQEYQIHEKISKQDSFSCDKYDRNFSTKQGLGIHLAWHTKNPKINPTYKPDISSNQTTQKTHFDQRTLQKSKCELCEEIFTGEHKYQTIQMLLLHTKMCSLVAMQPFM